MKILYTFLAVMLLAGCTRNDGDIGPYFGQWALEELDADGKPDAEYAPGTVFFAFQTDIVQVTTLGDNHTSSINTGTWSATDKVLTLYFNHHDNDTEAGTDVYAPPSWIHITEKVTEMQILELTSKRMTLRNGVYVYHLKKT